MPGLASMSGDKASGIGAPASSSNTPAAKGSGTGESDVDASKNTTPSGGTQVTCPNCGCQFDPKKPEDYTMPGASHGKPMPDLSGDLGSQISAALGSGGGMGGGNGLG